MQRISGAASATIVLAVTLYFTLFWGYDAVRMLTSPSYGLDDTFRSQYIFIIGRMFDFAPVQILKLAAFFAGVKMIVALACGWYFADRFRSLFRGQANGDVLEGGLILIVAISILSASLAARTGNGELVREYAIQLGLAFIATALLIFERRPANNEERLQDVTAEDKAAAPQGGPVLAA